MTLAAGNTLHTGAWLHPDPAIDHNFKPAMRRTI
jgi:hypothetical protein